MRNQVLAIVTICLISISCSKNYGGGVYTPPVNNPPVTNPILLKDIVIDRLPSPYYHFEYNSKGQIVFASFASGIDLYHVSYANDKIDEMVNAGPANGDQLQYSYDNTGKINQVTYIDINGKIQAKVLLEYHSDKLSALTRLKNVNNNFVTDKIMKFSYYSDGNVMEIIQQRFAVAGQNDASFSDKFEQYDTGTNVDGFSLIHDDFFDNLVLLPGVQIQKNNAGKVTRTGDGINYSVQYTFNYNDKNLPVSRQDEITITNGTDAGKIVQGQAIFSYY